MNTLRDRINELTESKGERLRNMSPAASEAADAAYAAIIEAAVPLFMNDDEGVDIEKMAAGRAAAVFYADILNLLVGASKEEIDALFEEGI